MRCSNGRSPVKIKEIIDELELDMYVVYNGQLVLLQIARLSTTLLNKKYWNILLNLQMRTIDKSFWCEKSVRWINDDAIRTIDFYQATSQLLPRKFPVRLMKKSSRF